MSITMLQMLVYPIAGTLSGFGTMVLIPILRVLFGTSGGWFGSGILNKNDNSTDKVVIGYKFDNETTQGIYNSALETFNRATTPETKLKAKEILDSIENSNASRKYIDRLTMKEITKEELKERGLVDENGNTINDSTQLKLNSTFSGGIGLTITNALQYTFWGIIITFIVIQLYKYIKNRISKKKKEEYAQANNVAIQEISIPLLCEYSLENKKYFKEMEIIDEVISNWFNSFKSMTIKGLYNFNNKGAIANKGLIDSINVGLKSGAIDGRVAKVSNYAVAYANNILPLEKGALLSRANVLKKG